MKARIAVPLRAAYFEGHFPGRPILPGVVELLLVSQALSGAANRPMPLRGIRFARLRQLVLPGDELQADARDLPDGSLRVAITRRDMVVANAELLPGRPAHPAPAARSPDVHHDAPQTPPLDALLPHRPPMRFVTSIIGETPDGLDCTARVPAECGLAHDGQVPLLAGVEAAAQSAAAWEAVRRWREGNPAAPRVGYLVALRDVEFFGEHLALGEQFYASVRLEDAAPPLTHYRFEVVQAGTPLARGVIATFLAAQTT